MKRTSWLGPVCWLLGAALGMGMSASAAAAILIEGTRVIYLSSDREVTTRIQNVGDTPSLVQTWIDDGSKDASKDASKDVGADAAKVPFVVSPPLFRVEPKQGQALRILHIGQPMVQDKETIFWLNVLELPPKRAADSDDSSLQLAFRSRIKLFYRPVALNNIAAIDKARAGLQWKRVSGADKKGRLEVSNASAYYITLVNLAFVVGERTVNTTEGVMVGPGGTATVELPKEMDAQAGASLKLKYEAINDFGALVPLETSVGK